MSRIANNPVTLPKGVDVTIEDQFVTVKGAKETLSRAIHRAVALKLEDGVITFSAKDNSKNAKAQSGTARALIYNMVKGVSDGFVKKLELVGVGYRAQTKGKVLNLTLGFSHPVDFPIPEGITIETPSQTEILVKGANKQLVGQVAANIRQYRPPEPYKGKGVKYSDEVIQRKETKKK